MEMEQGAYYLNEYIIPWGIKIITALVIFIIGRILVGMITRTTKTAMGRTGLDDMLVKFLGTLVYITLLAAVVLAAISKLGVNVTSLLAILGAAGLAVGLALKDSLSNFAAGVMIIIFRPFKIGDLIETAGVTGVVDEIGMFCTYMHSLDNKQIIVPNSAIINDNITNVNALGQRRIDLVIGISYDDNIGEARDIIQGIIDAESRILADPAPSIVVAELGDSSVNLFVRPWAKVEDWWAVKCELTEKIKVGLEAGGLSIPYPQQDVYLHKVEADAA